MTFKEFKAIAQEGKEGKIRHGSIINRFERFISVRLSWMLSKFIPGIRANHISFLNVVLISMVVLWPLILINKGQQNVLIVQIISFFLCSILDKVDGEIARVKKDFSQSGVYYDLLFHFLYSFSFYTFISIAFFQSTNHVFFFTIAILFAILATLYKMLGKIRHHVKYKIKLENHSEIIKDPIVYGYIPSRVERVIEYVLFMPYDWTLLLMIVILGIGSIDIQIALQIYLSFIIFGLIYSLYRILFWYPKNALYSKDDLMQ